MVLDELQNMLATHRQGTAIGDAIVGVAQDARYFVANIQQHPIFCSRDQGIHGVRIGNHGDMPKTKRTEKVQYGLERGFAIKAHVYLGAGGCLFGDGVLRDGMVSDELFVLDTIGLDVAFDRRDKVFVRRVRHRKMRMINILFGDHTNQRELFVRTQWCAFGDEVFGDFGLVSPQGVAGIQRAVRDNNMLVFGFFYFGPANLATVDAGPHDTVGCFAIPEHEYKYNRRWAIRH